MMLLGAPEGAIGAPGGLEMFPNADSVTVGLRAA